MWRTSFLATPRGNVRGQPPSFDPPHSPLNHPPRQRTTRNRRKHGQSEADTTRGAEPAITVWLVAQRYHLLHATGTLRRCGATLRATPRRLGRRRIHPSSGSCCVSRRPNVVSPTIGSARAVLRSCRTRTGRGRHAHVSENIPCAHEAFAVPFLTRRGRPAFPQHAEIQPRRVITSRSSDGRPVASRDEDDHLVSGGRA